MSSAVAAAAAAAAGTPPPPPAPPTAHQAQHGEYVLLRLSNGSERVVRLPLHPDEVSRLDSVPKKSITGGPSHVLNLGRFGSLDLYQLVGLNFGWTYERIGTGAGRLVPLATEEVDRADLHSVQAGLAIEAADGRTSADNRNLIDTNTSQDLTQDDILKLKGEGVSGAELIDAIIAGSKTFAEKTEFSQAKYIKRKQERHLRTIQILKTSLMNVAEHYYTRHPSRIMNIRPDTLSQMLSYANVQPGARVVVLDDCGGLVTAAALSRVGDSGLVVGLSTQFEEPGFEVVSTLNMPADQLDRTLLRSTWYHLSLSSEDIISEGAPAPGAGAEVEDSAMPAAAVAGRKNLAERRRKRQLCRAAARDELMRGNFDSLIVAARVCPMEAVRLLVPLLAPSRPFAIFSRSSSALAPTMAALRSQQMALDGRPTPYAGDEPDDAEDDAMPADASTTSPLPRAINLQIHDTWTREYQVLPGRSHPFMNMPGAASGFLLTGIRILTDPDSDAPEPLAGLQLLLSEVNQLRKRARQVTGSSTYWGISSNPVAGTSTGVSTDESAAAAVSTEEPVAAAASTEEPVAAAAVEQ
ncbi:hypothetical protein H696_05654 [Fonticula alba]|uniref:tRNA (adenine(58)-N(1))-methyltransferase non-catalytic subunit TRM6 n=1 Tax=Fonticula alba TaxID=691883 RepID=A0A058Z1X5_FONAL|nr:hypothetical protein H696_05654 [Fonticula alba]KCV67928.1 hypothetical protein H696_05654 [Fonticula alba]|eukprot:XP_009497748.1 hypothetical protein H696_05654 [Fonticula alba]